MWPVFYVESVSPAMQSSRTKNFCDQKCCGLVYIERFSYLRYSDLNLHLTVSTSVAVSATTWALVRRYVGLHCAVQLIV